MAKTKIEKLTNAHEMMVLCAVVDLVELARQCEGARGAKTKTATRAAVLHEARIHISPGNNKIGKCYNWSLPPLKSCTPEACATCGREGCYAQNDYEFREEARIAWDENYLWCLLDLGKWEEIMLLWFEVMQPDKFRIHVSGDFFSIDYGMAWVRIMRANPNCQFFAFSKQWDVIRACKFYEVENFKLRLSAWTGVVIPEDLLEIYDVAWCDDGIENRIPEDTYECPGNCDECEYFCLDDGDTFFHKHGKEAKSGAAKTAARLASCAR